MKLILLKLNPWSEAKTYEKDPSFTNVPAKDGGRINDFILFDFKKWEFWIKVFAS